MEPLKLFTVFSTMCGTFKKTKKMSLENIFGFLGSERWDQEEPILGWNMCCLCLWCCLCLCGRLRWPGLRTVVMLRSMPAACSRWRTGSGQ